jgi:hypothetical protein
VYGDAAVDMEARVKDKGYGLFEREDDWSSCAWSYLDQPANNLPGSAPVAERVAGLV